MNRPFSTRGLAMSLVSALALASATPMQAATASNDPNVISVVVRTGDLNLASEAGAKTLIARVHHAAETICGVEPATIEFTMHRIYEACVKATVDRTVATLSNPVVEAAYAGTSPGTLVLAASQR